MGHRAANGRRVGNSQMVATRRAIALAALSAVAARAFGDGQLEEKAEAGTNSLQPRTPSVVGVPPVLEYASSQLEGMLEAADALWTRESEMLKNSASGVLDDMMHFFDAPDEAMKDGQQQPCDMLTDENSSAIPAPIFVELDFTTDADGLTHGEVHASPELLNDAELMAAIRTFIPNFEVDDSSDLADDFVGPSSYYDDVWDFLPYDYDHMTYAGTEEDQPQDEEEEEGDEGEEEPGVARDDETSTQFPNVREMLETDEGKELMGTKGR